MVEFTSHNIRLDDGTETYPARGHTMDQDKVFLSTKTLLTSIFKPYDYVTTLVDLGCLEGGYAVEFARLGYDVLGIEIRESAYQACQYVKSKVNDVALKFVRDNAWNLPTYGQFDIVFCAGLLYHLDEPRRFLEMVERHTNRVAIFQTHFSNPDTTAWNLGPMTENENLPGRWQTEFAEGTTFDAKETTKWASWENNKSFWIQREHLIQAIYDAGFDSVMESFDHFAPDIAGHLLNGGYRHDVRGTFIGLKA